MFTKSLPTVAGVMSAFRKTIADLEAVAAAQQAETAKHDQIIADAYVARNTAAAEAESALDVKKRLEAVFG